MPQFEAAQGLFGDRPHYRGQLTRMSLRLPLIYRAFIPMKRCTTITDMMCPSLVYAGNHWQNHTIPMKRCTTITDMMCPSLVYAGNHWQDHTIPMKRCTTITDMMCPSLVYAGNLWQN
ncbi:hypothetical protein AVEN_92804-1 [Araneus ventricosus]|uniref:Uncharacterized protein n=1 Tax=Araneus ventricosus TaxID=182803 RepID=A0A4Y2N5X7_ARAVE|nr:hypothetical protein AVEN_92804-1 [Araneus ventricosus]